jgi:PAS domain S-box-containing protein
MTNTGSLFSAKVLVVDDTHANVDILVRILETEGYQVTFANNGQQALDIIPQVMPDLILLDVMMPEIDGFEVCKKLKTMPIVSEIPIIFITAKRSPQDLNQGFLVGGVDYITKPVNSLELKARVKTHLKLRQTTQQLSAEKNALYVEKERLKVTLISIGDGVIVTDVEGKVTLINPITETLTGYSQQEANGKPIESIFKLVHEKTKVPYEHPIYQVLRSQKTVMLAPHTLLISREGKEFIVEDQQFSI